MRVSGHKLEWEGGSLIRLPEPGATFGPDFFPDARGHEIPAAIKLAVQPFVLLRPGRAPLLIDTGYGTSRGAEFSHVLANLAAAGVGEEDVGQVFLTHLHGDHCAGLTKGAFPNAQIFLTGVEQQFWTGKDHPGGHLVAAEAHRLTLVSEGDIIAPGVRVVLLPGHTPGHAGLIIDDQILMIADVVHVAPLQIEDPDLVPKFDFDPGLAAQTRRKTLDWIGAKGLVFCGAHFTGTSPYFRLKPAGTGWQMVDA